MKEVSSQREHEPLLTIGMPVFNDIDFLEESLQSILAQTLTDFRLIISDDGSTDGSEAICRKYAAADKRITYFRQPKNLGISKNMEFLLGEAKTPYFMWAADDDLWHCDFTRLLIAELEKDSGTITAFCSYKLIDEEGRETSGVISPDFRDSNRSKRLKNFIKNPNDAPGYGLFKTEFIRSVRFPVWWWPNRKTPYNNIYPTLCYYLARGNYALYDKEVLFFKREKSEKKTNHPLVGSGNGMKETVAYTIRRFNLVAFSAHLIRKSGGAALLTQVYFTLLYRWFILSSLHQARLATKAFFRKKS